MPHRHARGEHATRDLEEVEGGGFGLERSARLDIQLRAQLIVLVRLRQIGPVSLATLPMLIDATSYPRQAQVNPLA